MIAPAPAPPVSYPAPTVQEMIGLARDYGILSRVEREGDRIKLVVLNEPMELSASEATIMLKGLLLGYFYNQARDDLSLARWNP